jgi:hypothetical protein
MIIHAATVELAPNELRLLQDSGLPLAHHPALGTEGLQLVPIGRADLAIHLTEARASSQDPAQLAVIASFLKQLRA